jgi:shikimate kinase
MGAGKTTVGARLAARLRRPFLDSDAQLTARVHRSAADIAATDGIDALHRHEAAALLDALTGTNPAVVAAAASVVDDPAARARLSVEKVTTVWLRARPDTLRERAATGAHRPFVGDDAAATDRLDRARRAAYGAAADLVVDVDGRERDDIAAEIEGALSG